MQEKKYIKSFDSLKGIAILLAVTIGHYWQFTSAGYWCEGENGWFSNLTNGITHFSFISYSYMELLLMISGFQLFFQYEKIARNEINFNTYLKKRVLRLFPMTVISTLMMFFGLICYKGLTGENWYGVELNGRYLIENLLCIQSWGNTFHTMNGTLWYVSVYFFCCILYFALVRIGEKINMRYTIMFVPILIGIFLGDKSLNILLLNADMCRGYLGFFMGVLAASLVSKLSKKSICIISMGAILGYLAYYTWYNEMLYTDNMLDRVLPTIVMLYVPLLMLLSVNEKLDSIVGNRVLAGLGKISYSLYVWNFPFLLWVAAVDRAFNLGIPFSMNYMYWIMAALQILIAIISYFGLEKPIYGKLNRGNENK